MQDLTIALLQTPLHWHSPDKNRAMLADKIQQLNGNPHLIILPEMFTTGFTMEAATFAEPMNGPTLTWLHEQAAARNAVITGSVIVSEKGAFYNRLIWMRPDGTFEYYNKRHLFRMAQEEQTFTAGNQPLVAELNGWRIFPLICYDLRFPVWSRNTYAYDLLLYVANWPARRALAWNTLLRARAIENLAYTAGVNRIGTDGNGHDYAGDSAVYGPDGATLCALEDAETCRTVTLSAQELNDFRNRFPAQLDADKFTLWP